MFTLAPEYTDFFIIYCPKGHSWEVKGDSQLEQQCEQQIDEGRGDLFILGEHDCPLCIERRVESQLLLQDVLRITGESFELLKPSQNRCQPSCDGQCVCQELKPIRKSRYKGQLFLVSDLVAV